MAVLGCPGFPVGGQHLPQGGGDRHLTGFSGFRGGSPVGQAAIHISPPQGQGLGDAGGGPSLDCPEGPVTGGGGSGQQLIQLQLSQGCLLYTTDAADE